MISPTPSPPSVPASAVDGLIASQLPAWLRHASAAQINRLRDRFRRHQASQAQTRSATVDLIPLQTFAKDAFSRLLADELPSGIALETLQWLDVRREFSQTPGSHWPLYRPRYVRQPGLLRLMQNFTSDDTVLQGSGLVRPGEDQVLCADPQRLAKACRDADVGGLYQNLLGQVFTASTRRLLAEDKRSALVLMAEIAALKGDISAEEQMVLHDVAHANQEPHEAFLRGYPGVLSLLGCVLPDAMVINLRDAKGAAKGVILYLPSDTEQALRRYSSWSAMQQSLVADLRRPAYRQAFSQLVPLEQRPHFLVTLLKRLYDSVPDLEAEGGTVEGDVFDELVTQQVRRIHSDARLLLVPTAQASAEAADARLQVWSGVGLGLVNLAGLFVPAVGAMLLGLLVVQTLSEVFEGAVDWYHGHQYEALEHMLGVAETLAVTAALAGGASVVARGFARSEFVEGLQPVDLGESGKRLWSFELDRYVEQPQEPTLQADGLYGQGERRWVRIAGRLFRVRRSPGDGPWRLVHPWRGEAYGPIVDQVGERGWRLRLDRPLEWHDEVHMLDTLWPFQTPVSAVQAHWLLDIAGLDARILRALLAHNATLPTALSDTLRRFEVDRRVTAFFTSLVQGQVPEEDAAIQAWCLGQPTLSGLSGEALRSRLLHRNPELRARLFEALSLEQLPADPLRSLIARDFPALPPPYAQQAAELADSTTRAIAVAESKLPLSLASQVRWLSQHARLNRAVEGLYLDNAYCHDTGALTLALLARLPGWTRDRRWVLREGAVDGRVIMSIGLDAPFVEHFTLIREEGEFRVYNSADQPLSVADDVPLLRIEAALVSTLAPALRRDLGVDGAAGVAQLRHALQAQLPASRFERLRLLGWVEEPHGFNPGVRLADGRVGYPLSDRPGPGPSSTRVLRQRLQVLYPALSDSQLDSQVQSFMQNPSSAYSKLLALEDDFSRLDRALETWTRAVVQSYGRHARRTLAERLRQAWRLSGESGAAAQGAPAEHSLNLSGPQVRSLPALLPPIEFPAITTLIIGDTGLQQISTEFLRCFGALRELNLSNNQLLWVPRGVGYLTDLRRLQLSRNNLRLDRGGIDALCNLRQLRSLDLSYNPLGNLSVSFGHLQHLVDLKLRNCHLMTWPEGVHLCAGLERVDLRDNQISRISADTLKMPNLFRRAFLVERNPLSGVELRRLYALDTVMEHMQLPEAFIPNSAEQTRTHWLAAATDRKGDAQLWDTLEGLPASSGFFKLLGRLSQSAEQTKAPVELSRRVWSLLETLNADTDLCLRVYELANEPPRSWNGVSELFSDLLRRAAISRAQRNTLHERGNELINLGQGLFRLRRLERFVRQDIRERLEALDGFDQLAVRLYYRVQLRKPLNLPFQPLDMASTDAVEVDEEHLQQAVQAVRTAETVESLSQSLAGHLFWQRYIQERHPLPFEAAQQAHLDREAALQAQRPALSQEALEQAQEALRLERDGHEHELILELTRQMLYGRERGLA
ncbi:hypothetical protein IAE35_13650 [Pseudomonas sp. S75]|uniref:NEL-type E3 ubiquitin ligase domain-containing protein n=1 Tax=unclassified Pseudomonas TaxID=196821 RepID=UPI0019071BB4|nr:MULTISPECIES: NEL-type E3 ubiquitin ligase domain-containing protein [unclassified Pseudomonas]MBJ9976572.1 hypothetical protein [Pseudomonas sp. S30]MBK0154388.1 hypothetical protein [Pseudomonas sp. S75]